MEDALRATNYGPNRKQYTGGHVSYRIDSTDIWEGFVLRVSA
jgi:hypothetical protein